MRQLSLLLVAFFAGCSFDGSAPFFPGQGGTGTLVRPDSPVLVDPEARYVWVVHDTSLTAVSISSGSVEPVYALENLSQRRLAFLPDDIALLVAEDAGGCPYETAACTRVARLQTNPAADEGAVRWEGSDFSFAIQSPTGRLVALSGGYYVSGAFIVDMSLELRPIQWDVLPGGVGWSRCRPDEPCDERLWTVGSEAIHSWPVSSGVLAPDPDLTYDTACDAFSWGASVAASKDGRWVALTCGGAFTLFDAESGKFRATGFHGPVVFAGDTIVGHDRVDENDEGDSYACLRFIDPLTLESRLQCFGDSNFSYYVSESGSYVLVSTGDALFVVEVATGDANQTSETVGILGGEFIERPGAGQVWAAVSGMLVVVDFAAAIIGTGGDVANVPMPFPVDHLNLIPGQDRLAILSSDSTIALVSMVTGSAELIALP